MKIMRIFLPLWKWEGAVLHGGTSQDFAQWAKKHLDADITPGANAAGYAYLAYGIPWALWVEDIKNVPNLAHEVFHITTGLLEARGLTLSNASEEAYTYTLEHILLRVLSNKKWSRA